MSNYFKNFDQSQQEAHAPREREFQPILTAARSTRTSANWVLIAP